MADCSKIVDFFRERKRMCDYYFDDREELCSSGCPFSIENNRHSVHCGKLVDSYTEKAVSVLQKWSDEHPLPKPKTYADDFFEKFPNTKYDPNRSYTSNGTQIPRVKRCGIYKSCKNVRAFCEAEDQVKCWLETYNEQEKTNG